jgi:CheY-like chemotaxis protein
MLIGEGDLPAPRRGGLRVLLAEDNPVNQRLAVRLLEKLGHQVTLVDSGMAVLERAACAAAST